MKKITSRLFVVGSVLCGLLLSSAPSASETRKASGRFECSTSGGTPETVIRGHEKREGQAVIRWTKSWSDRYTPPARCEQVTRKLNQNKNAGNTLLVPAKAVDNQPVVCGMSYNPGKSITCPDPQIIMTLRATDDAQQFVKDLIQTLNLGGPPVDHDGSIVSSYGDVTALDMAGLLEYEYQVTQDCSLSVWGCP